LAKVLLAAFDMDGTLLEENSSWVALHKHFGTSEKGEASLKLYSEGKINYIEFMRRDIASWPSDVTMKEVNRVLSHYRLRREAPRAVDRLRKHGIEVAVITSGIDILAEKVSRDLGIKHWTANGLQFDEEGRLTGEGIGRVDPTRKDRAFLKILRSLGIHKKQTIAVGDSIYDLRFLKTAWKGFLISKELDLSEHSIIRIEKLTDIFSHI
jgi:phosphoserine phosphatase